MQLEIILVLDMRSDFFFHQSLDIVCIMRLAHIDIFCYRWLYFSFTPSRKGQEGLEIQILHLASIDTQLGDCFSLLLVGSTSNSGLY